MGTNKATSNKQALNPQDFATGLPKSTPTYLSDYLASLTISLPSRRELEEIGLKLVEAKEADAILKNAGLPSKLQSRMPDRLDTQEIAITLCYIFRFANIMLSKDTETETVLGVYVTNGKDKGTYSTSNDYIKTLIYTLAPKCRRNDVLDILEYIKVLSPRYNQTQDKDYVIVNNGIYNKQTQELEPFTPDRVYMSKLAIDYVPNAPKPLITEPDGSVWDVDQWIRDLSVDDETYELIWQVISDFIQAGITRKRAIFFYSESGNNGKGTLGQLIKNLVGPTNYSSLAIADFNHEFLKESLINVVGNIADENDVDQYIDSARDFKATITGDDININRKFKAPVRFQFKGSNIQMLNGLPKTRDKSDSFYRRLILVPFLKSFTNNGEKTYIKDDYIARTDVLEYVLAKALNINFDEFTIPQRSKELLSDYKEANNPIIQFWNEVEPELQWDLVPIQFLYDLYYAWFDRNNPSGIKVGKHAFNKELRNILENQSVWTNKFEKNDTVKTLNRMDADEPLITEYHLTDWMDTTASHRTKSPTTLRNFPRKSKYRGILRV